MIALPAEVGCLVLGCQRLLPYVRQVGNVVLKVQQPPLKQAIHLVALADAWDFLGSLGLELGSGKWFFNWITWQPHREGRASALPDAQLDQASGFNP